MLSRMGLVQSLEPSVRGSRLKGYSGSYERFYTSLEAVGRNSATSCHFRALAAMEARLERTACRCFGIWFGKGRDRLTGPAEHPERPP
jgi:hypothetical protein